MTDTNTNFTPPTPNRGVNEPPPKPQTYSPSPAPTHRLPYALPSNLKVDFTGAPRSASFAALYATDPANPFAGVVAVPSPNVSPTAVKEKPKYSITVDGPTWRRAVSLGLTTGPNSGVANYGLLKAVDYLNDRSQDSPESDIFAGLGLHDPLELQKDIEEEEAERRDKGLGVGTYTKGENEEEEGVEGIKRVPGYGFGEGKDRIVFDMSKPSGVTGEGLKEALRSKVDATVVEIEDMSGGCGQAFSALIVSPLFEKKTTLARHRLVNAALKDEVSKIHAWTMKCYTPAQYEAQNGSQKAEAGEVDGTRS